SNGYGCWSCDSKMSAVESCSVSISIPLAQMVAGGQFLSAEIIRHSGQVYAETPELGDQEQLGEWTFNPSLNPREWVEVQLILDGGGKPMISARIADESRSFRRQTLPPAKLRATRISAIWGLVGILLGGEMAWHAHSTGNWSYYFWPFLWPTLG